MNRCDECKHRHNCICVPYGCESFEIDIEEHDKQIYNKALEDFGKKMKEANSLALYYQDVVDLEKFMKVASDEIKEELMK